LIILVRKIYKYIIILEFLASTIQQKEAFKEEKLADAFKAFDKDGSGKISVNEINMVLGLNDEEEKKRIVEIVQHYDINHDGEIDMEEFVTMMSKLEF
jgi:calcium-dependent protein kinase